MELMTPHIGTIFWTAVTFIALLVILYKVGWKPILAILEERERKIRESLQTADRLQQEAKKSAEERQKVVDSGKKEVQEILNAGRTAAETIRDEILKKAQDEANGMVDRAKREIEAERDEALRDIRKLAVELSMAATEKLIGKSMTAKDHEKLINDSLAKMEQLN
jgi:F-type H+-transporting ATPase subunit b